MATEHSNLPTEDSGALETQSLAAPSPVTLDSFAFRAALVRKIKQRLPEKELLHHIKEKLNELANQLIDAFTQSLPTAHLLKHRADCIDSVLTLLWQHLVSINLSAPATLAAVGGYGRRELHLHSDIDLLFLFDNEFNLNNQREVIEHFVAFLWDTGLKVGHSVRVLGHCLEQARADISIATNLMEARLLAGDGALFDHLLTLTTSDAALDNATFFKAKLAEQHERHEKHGNTECNLEPNLKEAPGGLRDIQTIVWITRKHFGVTSLQELVQNEFLTQDEYTALNDAQNFFWKLRYALHCLTKRDENRILFDFQRTLAQKLGYPSGEKNQAVEALMQDYYRAAMTVSELNEQLMHHFQENIIQANSTQKISVLNDRFRLRENLIEVIHSKIFKEHPSALLEIFVLLAQHEHIDGIRASTIRLIRSHCYLIDDAFRENAQNKHLFMTLLRSPHRLFTQLRRMKRYGVLAQYIPTFRHTVGQMQYDLFHVYTVDAHILYVVRNIRRFLKPALNDNFPLASQLAQSIPKKELLFLAALFHDMAKGRNGDHSELGAIDAKAFCLAHGLNEKESDLVAWLVKYHLLMSSTAQKKDITDSEVILEFARKVGELKHLDYLYVLTVADITGTNPKLWNTWRDALLKRLYHETKRALYRGLFNPIANSDKILEQRASALSMAIRQGLDENAIRNWWDTLSDEYFLRETPENIVWHTQVKLEHADRDDPLVAVQEIPSATAMGNTNALQIFVCSKDMPNLFLASTATLERLGLSILDARIITSPNSLSLDTYLVIDPLRSGSPYSAHQLHAIQRTLAESLTKLAEFQYTPTRRLPRELRHFDVQTEVRISGETTHKRTMVEVISLDRPGLLAIIANQLRQYGLEVHSARIATLGERAEDIFMVTDADHHPISDVNTRENLAQSLIQALDNLKN